MKYIITEKQYKILQEQQEILTLPGIEYFGGWNKLQSFLKRKGNPLYSIDGNLDLYGTPIESLGALTSVEGYLDLYGTPIESLGNLTSVGGDLNLEGTLIKSLGALTSVGGNLYLRGNPAFQKYSIEEIEKMVNVKGNIYK